MQMWFLHAATDYSCTGSPRALRSLRSCLLGVQNIHYWHSLVQIYMLAFMGDMHSCFLLQTQPKREQSMKPCQRPHPRPVSTTGMRLNLAHTNGRQWLYTNSRGWEHTCAHYKPSTSLHFWTQQSQFSGRTWKCRRKTLSEISQLIISALTIVNKNWEEHTCKG